MFLLELVLLVLATWRLYRLVALDTGPYQILRRFRKAVGVKYNNDHTEWSTKDGSFAEMLTCSKCAPLWEGGLLTLFLFLVPTWLFLLVTLPLSISAVVLFLENGAYAPLEKRNARKEKW